LLPAVQGGGTGQGHHVRGRRLHSHVMVQLVMIVQALVAQGQGIDALPQQQQQLVCATGFAAHIAQHPGERLGGPNLRSTAASNGMPPLPVMSPPQNYASTWRPASRPIRF